MVAEHYDGYDSLEIEFSNLPSRNPTSLSIDVARSIDGVNDDSFGWNNGLSSFSTEEKTLYVYDIEPIEITSEEQTVVYSVYYEDNDPVYSNELTVPKTPIELSENEADDVWYVDRYAPSEFKIEHFDGDYRLKHSISENNGLNNRSNSYNSEFYNTQGRKYNTDNANKISIDLYIASDWETTNRRMAGLWATGFDTSEEVSLYPIIEFTSDGNNPRFHVWDVDGWVDIGLPSDFSYDKWYTLSIELDTEQNAVILSVGDLSYVVDDINGTIELGNMILQGHNTNEGVNYDIYWDNISI